MCLYCRHFPLSSPALTSFFPFSISSGSQWERRITPTSRNCLCSVLSRLWWTCKAAMKSSTHEANNTGAGIDVIDEIGESCTDADAIINELLESSDWSSHPDILSNIVCKLSVNCAAFRNLSPFKLNRGRAKPLSETRTEICIQGEASTSIVCPWEDCNIKVRIRTRQRAALGCEIWTYLHCRNHNITIDDDGNRTAILFTCVLRVGNHLNTKSCIIRRSLRMNHVSPR